MLIKSNFPIDETFLSSVVNEGILYLASSIDCKIKFNGSAVIVELDCDLKQTFKEAFSSISGNINVGMVRNDRHFINDFKKYFNINTDIRQTFQDLILKVKENIDNFEFKYDHLDLSIIVKGSTVLFESNKRKVDVVAPQIFKVDRFTGYTSLETKFTTKQLKQRCLGETALRLILGLSSAYVCSRRDGNNWYYYFLTFAPDEVSKMYLEGSNDLIRKYLIVKNEVMKILEDSYAVTSANEIPITELALNLKVQKLLNQNNLDKVSFILFKVAREGSDSYKIYEQIPIRIYRKINFAEIVERYFRNPDDFVKRLSEIFDKSENRRLWDALKNKDSPNYPEGDNVLKAMQGLYRFVILGDLQGYYQFVREIFNCYQKTENRQYKRILERLGWF